MVAVLLAFGWLTHQEKLDPDSFLDAVGWADKPGSLLIFPESGGGSPLLPLSSADRRTGLINMLRADRFGSSALLIPGGQNNDATPVVFVHGLMSTPSMWSRMVHDLREDPEIAGRYQFWFFYYPTGQPIPLSALQLRETLDGAVRMGRLVRPVVIVGHSMGGILARSQAVTIEPESAEAILPGVSSVASAGMVRDALIFPARSDVARLVWIATPHRGTDFAFRPISMLGHHLIRLPAAINAEIASFEDSFPELGGRRFPTSIVGLSPDSGFLRTINSAPLAAPAHSIIPLIGRSDDPFAHDGVVPLWSSRVMDAESELIIPGDHGAFDTPESLNELRRILLSHAGLSPRPGNGSAGNQGR